MKFKLTIMISAVTFMLMLLSIHSQSTLGAGATYKNLLKNQGFTPMQTPRTKFGVGTIFGQVGNNKELIIRKPDDCFPGAKFDAQDIKLLDSKRDSGLDFKVGASYLPAGDISGAFGYDNVKKLDVTFGETKEYVMTLGQLKDAIADQQIKKKCLDDLRSDRARLILSVAEVQSMEFKFQGNKKVGASFDAGKLAQILKVNLGLNYTSNNNDTLTLQSPMYIAYKAVKFKDLGIPVNEAESGDTLVRLPRGKFDLIERGKKKK